MTTDAMPSVGRALAWAMMLCAAIVTFQAVFGERGVVARAGNVVDAFRHWQYDQGTPAAEDVRFAEDVYARIVMRDTHWLFENTHPFMRPSQEMSLSKAAPAGFCPEAIGRQEVTGGYASVQKAQIVGRDRKVGVIGLQYQCGGLWYGLALEVVRDEDVGYDKPWLFTWSAGPQRGPLQQTNAFGFTHGPTGYRVFLVEIGVTALFVAYALAVCVCTKRGWRRVTWSVFIAVAVLPTLSRDWASGDWDVVLLALDPFGMGWSKASPYAPTQILLGIPVGAIWFLLKRRPSPRHAPVL